MSMLFFVCVCLLVASPPCGQKLFLPYCLMQELSQWLQWVKALTWTLFHGRRYREGEGGKVIDMGKQ